MTESTPITRRQWLAMATLSLGVSLVIMDATIVNVALPVVIEDLGLDAAGAQWMNAIYALVFASLMLTVGRIGDLYGRKRLYAVGLVVFMVASLGAGAATTPAMLIASRFVQGLGAAMVLPSTLATLNAMFQGRARGIAFAIWGSTIGGMAAVGPLIGGWLATDVSWRWAFWLNIPFGLLALVGVVKTLDETRDPSLQRGADIPGVLLSSIGLAGIVFALIEGDYYGWWRTASGGLSPVPVTFALGLALVAAFVVVERRRVERGKVALVDLGLLRIPSFRYGIVAALIVSLGEFGLLFTLPLLLQGALGYSALGTGWIVLWLALGTFLISGATPRLARRLGPTTVVRDRARARGRRDRRPGADAEHVVVRCRRRRVALRLRRGGRTGHRTARRASSWSTSPSRRAVRRPASRRPSASSVPRSASRCSAVCSSPR